MNSGKVKIVEGAFKKFFTDELLATIIENTNKYIASNEKFVDEPEFLAFYI